MDNMAGCTDGLQESAPNLKNLTTENAELKSQTEKIISQINSALTSKDYYLADQHIKALKAINPDPMFTLKRAHLMFIRENYLKAEKLYKKILTTAAESDKVEIYFGLGQTYFEMKKFSESHFNYTCVTSYYSDYKYIDLVYLRLVRILVSYQNYSAAVRYIKPILVRQKASKQLIAEALMYLGLINRQYGKVNKSINICRKAVKLFASFSTMKGFCALLAQEYPKIAEKVLQKAINKMIKPEEWKFFSFLRAAVCVKLRKFQKAVCILEEECKDFELENYYLNFLGVALYGSGEKVKAVEVFQRIRAKFEGDEGNLRNLACGYWELGLKEEAFYVCGALERLRNGERVEVRGLKVQEPYLDLFQLVN